MARTPPEGKARSRRNVPKHGLRAKLLPLPLAGDDAARFQELAAGLRRTYRPEDAAEAQLVGAIAVAMWQEIATDRLEAAEALAAMAGGEGRPFRGNGPLVVDEEVYTNELPPPPAPASANDDSAGTPTDRTNDFDPPDRTRASPRRCAAVAARLAAGGGR